MAGVVYTDIPRLSVELVTRFKEFGVATVHEAMGRTGLMGSAVRPLDPRQQTVGQAVTAWLAPGDNLGVHVAMHYAQPGDVIVASCGGTTPHGVFGDLLATSAVARGLAAFVTDSGVRDCQAITELALPVWAGATFAQGTVKEALVSVNAPISMAGVAVHPGDVIVGDGDGVVVVPWQEAETVAERAAARDAREEHTRDEYSRGVSSYEHHRLDELLEAKGIRTINDCAHEAPGERAPAGT
jgi:4-hydroxy-4-methyl-2-oxoglutarate aldolase